MTNKAIIYTASHRMGGNSDHAATLLADGVKAAGGQAEIIAIRNHTVMPCRACGFCSTDTGRTHDERCVLGSRDDAWELFAPLLSAPVVFFTSPIYFYHLPSMFKTWIDRSQQFWSAKQNKEPWIADLPKRTAHVVMVAGRPTGEKLFEGARITLKYFLHNFNLTLADPVVFRGIDDRDDLKRHEDFEARVVDMARHAWESRS